MANLTLSDLQTEVYDHTGLDSSSATRVTRWLNYVQQDIQSRWPWPWAYGRESVTTIADYSTGTVSVSSGGTAVAGVSTAWTATQGDGTYFMQFSGANDWYRVSARGGVTSITLETAYQGTVALSGATYTLRKFFYSLSTSADEVLDVRNWDTPLKLLQVDFRTLDLVNPLVQSVSPGYAYLMFGVDSSGNLQFTPYPFPSDARLFEFRTKKRSVDMASAGDSPSIPNKYAQVIAWGAIAVGFAFLRKFQEASVWNGKFEGRIAQMKKEYRQSEDHQPILGSIDRMSRGNGWLRLPASYPTLS